MRKLFNILFVLMVFVASFFLTGCDNSDDYMPDSKPTPVPTDKEVVFNIGVYSAPSQSVTSERAVIQRAEYITLADKQMKYVSSENDCYMYSGTFNVNELNAIIAKGYAKLVYPGDTNSSTYLGKEFFTMALDRLATAGTTSSVVKFSLNTSLDRLYSSVTIDGQTPVGFVPTISKNGFVGLVLNGNTVIATVPSEAGSVTSYGYWIITVDGPNGSKPLDSKSGCLSVSVMGNNQANISITEKGAKQLTLGYTYKVSLRSVTVYNQAGESMTLSGANTITYTYNGTF